MACIFVSLYSTKINNKLLHTFPLHFYELFSPGSSSSSSSIVFEGGDGGEDVVDANSPPPQTTSTPELPELQFMYIQMEFCEKSTLRYDYYLKK